MSDRGLPPLGVLGAIQFLTRVPVRLRAAPDLASCIGWFPIVGTLIGTVVGGVAAGAMEWTTPGVAAALAVIAGLMVTGAFHEDGLADTMDALGGSTPARRREILKDSRHGSYGVAALCSSVVLRVVCVASLGPAAAFAGAVAAHTLGRGAAVAVTASAPAVPGPGLGSESSRALRPRAAVVSVAAAVVLSALATGWWAGPLVLAAGAGALAIAWLATRAFEGTNGDVLGCVEQVAECAVLVVTVGLATRYSVWWT